MLWSARDAGRRGPLFALRPNARGGVNDVQLDLAVARTTEAR